MHAVRCLAWLDLLLACSSVRDAAGFAACWFCALPWLLHSTSSSTGLAAVQSLVGHCGLRGAACLIVALTTTQAPVPATDSV
jgi:hypothetical protein